MNVQTMTSTEIDTLRAALATNAAAMVKTATQATALMGDRHADQGDILAAMHEHSNAKATFDALLTYVTAEKVSA